MKDLCKCPTTKYVRPLCQILIFLVFPPLLHGKPQQYRSAGLVTSQGVAQVIQNVSHVGDDHCQLSGDVTVQGGNGGDVGQVGDAAKQEISWRLLSCSTGGRRPRENIFSECSGEMSIILTHEGLRINPQWPTASGDLFCQKNRKSFEMA